MDMTNLPEDEDNTASEQEAKDMSAAMDAPAMPDANGNMQVEENEDGSANVTMLDTKAPIESDDFSENLADILEERVLSSIGIDLCDRVQSDKDSREERDRQYAEGIKRTGLGNDAPGGAEFDGASKAVHPMLAKGCVDFASKAIKELYPAAGPVKTQIIGRSSDDKIDKAERKKTYINWQLTTQVQENRSEFERLLSQLPLGGTQYKRWWWDGTLKRLRTETVYVDDVFLPYSQSDFWTSHRVTHRQYISQIEYERRVISGLYRDVSPTAPSLGMSNRSESSQATDKVEGSEEDSAAYNEEGLREIYQVYVDLEVEDDPEAGDRTAPYILHVEAYSNKVLGLYRNWKEGDETFAKKHWMVEYTFIPWRGAYGVGLTHLIGSLSAAATGALRALLDSAHIANFPGGLKLKGGRSAGQNIQVNATELQEIEGPTGADDIRKLIMPFPFNGPSPVLQTLMEWLTQQAEGVIATASEKIADGGANMPMGTALALIEQGSVNFSAIHARLHASLKKELEIVHRLNAEHLTDDEVVEDLGELVVSRADFQGPMDIIPVSDPNIFSEAQRYAQLQAVLQLKGDPTFAPFFRADKLLERALKLLQFPAPEDVANLPKDPRKMGPLDENFTCASPEPSPLKVYADQDDLAHLETHVHFMNAPMFGANAIIAPVALPALLAHCKDHLMAFYQKHTRAASDAMLQVSKHSGNVMTDAQANAKGSAFADKLMAEMLGPLVMPGLQQAEAMMKTLSPPPPAAPEAQLAAQTAAAAQAAQTAIAQAAEAGRQATAQAAEQNKIQLKQMELAYQSQRDALDRANNASASQIAAQTEASSDAVQERMSQFAAKLELLRDDKKAEAAQLALEFENRAAQQLEVLKAMLASQAENLAAQADNAVNPLAQGLADSNKELTAHLKATQAQSATDQQNMQALLGSIGAQGANTQGTMAEMVKGMQALHAAHQKPKVVEYVRDKNGKVSGVRTSPG